MSESIPVEGLTTWEPNWVGAVIEDGHGAQWVKVHRGGGPAQWHVVDWKYDGDPWAVWSAIPGPTYLHKPGFDRAVPEHVVAFITVSRVLDEEGGMRDDVTTDDGQGGEIDLPTAVGMLAVAQHTLLSEEE